jgi:hypothetical protein
MTGHYCVAMLLPPIQQRDGGVTISTEIVACACNSQSKISVAIWSLRLRPLCNLPPTGRRSPSGGAQPPCEVSSPGHAQIRRAQIRREPVQSVDQRFALDLVRIPAAVMACAQAMLPVISTS